MALISPGVEVQVIDESFYTPAEPGTVPLVVVATAENKLNGAGTATASGTLAANAGKVFRVTSQRELVELYGAPFFEKTASGSPIHGGERNEYGLLAAYSLLGVSNSAYIVRANVDLNELEGTTEEPGSAPTDGDWWLDTQTTTWGIQEWNGAAPSVAGGQRFTTKTPIVLTDTDDAKLTGSPARPKESVGIIGDYAVVVKQADDDVIRVWYKSAGNGDIAGGGTAVAAGQWVLVGTKEWTAGHPTVKGTAAVGATLITGAIDINGQNISFSGRSLSQVITDINGAGIDGVNAQAVNGRLYLYVNGITTDTIDSSSANFITLETPTTGTIGNVLTGLGLTLGTYYGPALQMTPHTQVPAWKVLDNEPRPTGSVWIKTTEPNGGARIRVKEYNASTGAWAQVDAPIYASGHAALYYLDRAGGGTNIPADSLFVQSNYTENTSEDDVNPATAEFRIFRRTGAGVARITSDIIGTGSFTGGGNTFTVSQSVKGSLTLVSASGSFTATGTASDADEFAAAINNLDFGFDGDGDPIASLVSATVDANNRVAITHAQGGEIRFTDGTSSPIASVFTAYDYTDGSGTLNFYDAPSGATETYVASNWRPLAASTFEAGVDAPLGVPEDGQLWYNPAFGDVDMLAHDGSKWDGYLNVYPATDPEGPIVSATMPEDGDRSDGGNLVANDLWISTADLENFPTVYRFNPDAGSTLAEKWVLVDKTDQSSEEGILFADARWADGGAATEPATIVDLLISDYVDPDAPDPDLYPKGMLLWNLRRSGGNVKRYVRNYINTTADNERLAGAPSMDGYNPDRWVTASPNNEDGSGSFGRKAQRSVVVAAMKSVVDTSEEARDEERRDFNIIAAPGYPELLSNLVNLNLDRKVTAFVVGDTPLRLRADATSLTTWGSNANLALDNNDNGIVTYDEYCAVYYPNGFTTDLSGTNAVVPASHMMLRTIALSDQVSYPWFAPAGTRRGGITNATAVGYIDTTEGEFVSVALNNGQRDTLYDLKVNPIPFFNGVGLVAYGQKTRARNASALDRINVARLVVYLRRQLTKLARPYIFEPNDQLTRDEIKQAVESLLLELVGLRAIYDFAVVCDESNNTPARIDRNELYVDVAIEPTKAVEFIYIPLRLKNTGEI